MCIYMYIRIYIYKIVCSAGRRHAYESELHSFFVHIKAGNAIYSAITMCIVYIYIDMCTHP